MASSLALHSDSGPVGLGETAHSPTAPQLRCQEQGRGFLWSGMGSRAPREGGSMAVTLLMGCGTHGTL